MEQDFDRFDLLESIFEEVDSMYLEDLTEAVNNFFGDVNCSYNPETDLIHVIEGGDFERDVTSTEFLEVVHDWCEDLDDDELVDFRFAITE
jgi:hypothetical protein